MKSTKKSLIASALSLVLCVSMLLGTTYAWFTDSVTSGKNKIIAGNLDVELTHTNAKVTNEKVQDATNLFGVALWEPGVIAYENFTVTNVGNLALKYALNLNVFDKNATTENHDLTEVIKVAVIDGGFKPTGTTPEAKRAEAQELTFGTLADFQKTGNLAGGDSTGNTFGVVLYWQPTDNDNLYNLKNGLKSTDNQPLFVEFGVNLVATQDTVEADSFDKYYDKSATFPNIPAVGTKATKTETVPEDAKTNGMTIKNELATLEIPGENIDENASKYRLDIERIENIEEGENVVTLSSEGDTLVTYDVKLVKIDHESVETTIHAVAEKEYTVTLFVGTHCDLVKLYHKGVEIENFDYNPASGEAKYKTKSFSPYAAEIKFAGGTGTSKYPYILENTAQWNKLYQETYDWNKDIKPYFILANDIDFANVPIKNYAMDSNNQPSYGFFMQFDLDGNGHALKNITTLDGYCQPFPYIWDTSIHDITIDYNLDETRTAAMVYYPCGDNYFTNVTTTGSIETTADWATPYVAYMYKAYTNYNCNVTYKNCTNYANIKGGYGNSGYTAVFGSHNAGGGHITFDNCANYGGLLGGHVGFVGMGNDTAYTFVDENAVKNFGSAAGTKSVGYFNNSGDAETKTIGGITCQVKQEGATKKMSTTHTTTLPENFGEVISIDEVKGATKYDVQMSFSVGVYNYSTVGKHWGGGFPRHLTFSFTDQDVVNGKIATPFRKAYLGEVKADQYYGYDDTKPTYEGVFLPDGFSLDSKDVKVLENQGDVYLVEYKESVFYVMYSSEYHGWYALLSTNDDGEITTKNITVSYSVTAYNPDGSVLSFSSTSYNVPVETAKTFFNQLG